MCILSYYTYPCGILYVLHVTYVYSYNSHYIGVNVWRGSCYLECSHTLPIFKFTKGFPPYCIHGSSPLILSCHIWCIFLMVCCFVLPFMLLSYMLYYLYFETLNHLFSIISFRHIIIIHIPVFPVHFPVFLIYSPQLIPFPIFPSCQTFLVADPRSLFPEVTCVPFWECQKYGVFQKGNLVKHGISDFRSNVSGAFFGCVYKKYILSFCV